VIDSADYQTVANIARDVIARSELGTLVRQLQGTARGTVTLVFSANNDANLTFSHGLKATPSNVQLTPRDGGSSSIRAPACTDRTPTDLTITARSGDGTNVTMSVDVDWVAWL
jgi:hypothetical protein